MKPNKSSSTAALLARSTVFIAHDPLLGHLVPPRVAELGEWFLEATSRSSKRLLWLIEQKWFRGLVGLAQSLTIPGLLLHHVVRKRFIEDVVRQSLESGIEQVVVLGAGFDTLTVRLAPEFSSVTFIEVDHPATQQVKIQVLQEHQAGDSNLHFLPVDLSQQSLEDTLLLAPHYKSDAPTLFVAEGLLMYLEPDKVSELFEFVAQHSAKGSRFTFTFLEPHRGGRTNFYRSNAFVDLWLGWRGERFRWGIRRRQLATYLTPRGLHLEQSMGERALRERYLSGFATVRLARGEYIAVAKPD